MKGTLYSADFVTDYSGSLRLLEVNTDTGFLSSSLAEFNFNELFYILSSSNISEVHTVHKGFQQSFVDHLSASLASTDLCNVSTFTQTLESDDTIYPTDVTDSDSKFILRLAYNESALFDSEFAKDNINLYRLFTDAAEEDNVVEHFYSMSIDGAEYDNLPLIDNQDAFPDIVYKNRLSTRFQPLHFLKIDLSAYTGSSDDWQVAIKDDLKKYGNPDDSFYLQYYPSIGSTNSNSIRSFNIIYGDNLDNVHLATFVSNAIFTLPTGSLTTYADQVGQTQYLKTLTGRHYYEFATNHPLYPPLETGLLSEEGIIKLDGTVVTAESASVGDTFKSYKIEGLPNTDDPATFMSWSFAGSSLPSGSEPSSSVLQSNYKKELIYNVIGHIELDGGGDIWVSPRKSILVYNSVEDKIQFKSTFEVDPSTHKLFNVSGSLVDITTNELVIIDSDNPSVNILDFEDLDTYFIEGAGEGGMATTAGVITHNACFPGYIRVLMSDGEYKPIEDVELGDEVQTYNVQNKHFDFKKVIGKESPIHNDLITITIKHDEFDDIIKVECTYDHPIFKSDFSLVSYKPDATKERYDSLKDETINQLEVGQQLFLANGTGTITDISENSLAEDVQTYIIRVEDNHNFFAENILVHNK